MTEDSLTFIPMQLDQASAFERFRKTGDIYDTVIETLQNAFDAPLNPLEDPNEIQMLVPGVEHKQYKKISFCIEDLGGSLTKNYGGKIDKFLGALKAKSNKALTDLGKYGVGMILYLNLGHKVVFVTRDKKNVYQFDHFLNSKRIPGYDNLEQESVLDPDSEKFNMPSMGTRVIFYGDVELDVNKVKAKIQKIYGWRMGLCPKTKVILNGDVIEIPEDLKGKNLRAHLSTLGKYKIKDSDGTEERTVNPRVTGFIEPSRKGAGRMRVYVKGYYIGDISCCVPGKPAKQCEGALNCDELPIDLGRKHLESSDMLTELTEKIAKENMAKYPDMENDKSDLDDKKAKSLQEQINKALSRFDLPRLWKKNEADRKRIMIEQQGEKDGDDEGRIKREQQSPVVCKLCGHLKRVLNCDCKCHITKPIRPPTEIPTVDGSGTGQVTVLIRSTEEQEHKDPHSISINRNNFGEAPLFSVAPGANFLRLNTHNEMYYHCIIESQKQSTQRIAPFLAYIVMDAEHPNALTELTAEKYRRLHESITYKILDGFGHHVKSN